MWWEGEEGWKNSNVALCDERKGREKENNGEVYGGQKTGIETWRGEEGLLWRRRESG
jgi:hypothetical protein